jgi:hypothetical protein
VGKEQKEEPRKDEASWTAKNRKKELQCDALIL